MGKVVIVYKKEVAPKKLGQLFYNQYRYCRQ